MRLNTIEYLRGLAALAVAWFHLTNTYGDNWVRASGAYGWLGVEVFFVISGFVIPYALATEKLPYSIFDFPRFMARRLARLEPPYILSVALALILWNLSAMAPGFAGKPPANDVGQIGAHLLYLVPVTGHDWLQPVYWTLACEFVFYIFVGLLFPWFGVRRAEIRLFLLMIALLICVQQQWISILPLLFVIGIAAFKVFDAVWCTGLENWRTATMVRLHPDRGNCKCRHLERHDGNCKFRHSLADYCPAQYKNYRHA